LKFSLKVCFSLKVLGVVRTVPRLQESFEPRELNLLAEADLHVVKLSLEAQRMDFLNLYREHLLGFQVVEDEVDLFWVKIELVNIVVAAALYIVEFET
jgi:hypothetical protein